MVNSNQICCRPLGDNFVYAYIHNDDADNISVSPEDKRSDAIEPPQPKRLDKGTPEKQATKKPRKKKTIQQEGIIINCILLLLKLSMKLFMIAFPYK